MGALEDTYDEFKKGSKTEKVVIAAAVLGVGLIVYLHYRNSNTSGSSGQGSASATTGSNQNPGLQTFPYGSTPVLDNSGNPVAVIGPPASTPTQTSSGGTTTPGGTTSNSGPLIPYNFFKNGKFPTIAGQPNTNVKNFTYQGVNYSIQAGPGGKVYGTNGGKQVLLYGPPSMYPPKQGGGAFGTRVLGQHGKRIAPTREGTSYVAKMYARRTGV